ncbi:hypothetical protein ACWGPW_24365 [Paenibacillus chitinolyticus]
MQETVDLTYHDGIAEGRLIENSFIPVGQRTFYHTDTKFVYVVTVAEQDKATLEVFKFYPYEGELLVLDYINLLRDEGDEVLLIKACLADILAVIKMHRTVQMTTSSKNTN